MWQNYKADCKTHLKFQVNCCQFRHFWLKSFCKTVMELVGDIQSNSGTLSHVQALSKMIELLEIYAPNSITCFCAGDGT